VFVAIKGYHRDGHDYVMDAVRRGATAIVAEQPVSCAERPLLVVKSSRAALARLATLFNDHPSKSLLVTGVTGTNGKTTTACMIDAIHEAAGFRAGLIGTVVVRTGNRLYRANLTTPDALELQSVLAEMRDQGVSRVAMEVSSQGLALHRVDGVEFDIGVFTNITADHLDFHRSVVQYLRAKARFARALAPSSISLINADDYLASRLGRLTRARIVTFGIESDADVVARRVVLDDCGSTFEVEVTDDVKGLSGQSLCKGPIPIRLSLLGLHNVYNGLAATAAALAEGIDPGAIQSGLAHFRPVERRSVVFRLGDHLVVDDTALNGGSYDAILDTVHRLRPGRVTLVCAIRGNRGIEVNLDIARVLAKWRDLLGFRLITTSSRSHVGEADRVSVEEETAFLAELHAQDLQFLHFAELPDAITAAARGLQKRDALLLLGAQGMDRGVELLMEAFRVRTAELPSTAAWT
jgi:UDP-N-acetylmuramoyl-L-alanyl-D-glutamate--2,6-diaminopimelate ligase